MARQSPYPLWLRTTHWLNAVAVVTMVLSGWRIYNASPFWPFRIPDSWTLGGWLAGALQWHFTAMWLLFFNGLFYLLMNILTGRFRTKYAPLDAHELLQNIKDTLRIKLRHDDLNHYNMIQKLMYLGIILVLILIVLSGLVLWKNVQFPLLRTLFGGYETARRIHFVCMGLIVTFTCIHVVMALLVPRTIKGMVSGRL